MGPYERFLVSRGVLLSLGATAVLTVTMVFSQSQRLIDAVTNFGMPLSTFVGLLVTLAPFMADGALVAGVAVGMTFVLLDGRGSRELLIGEALGLSPWQRFLPFLAASAVLVVIQVVLSMFVAPPSYRLHQQTRKDFGQEVNFADFLNPGVTVNITPTTSIYMHNRIDGQNFLGIKMFDATTKGREVTTFANRGAIHSGASGLSILLFEGFQVNEATTRALPQVTTFSALPIVFDRAGQGFSTGRLGATPKIAPDQVTQGSTRSSFSEPDTPDRADGEIDVSSLTPSEIPPGIALETAWHVINNLDTQDDLSVQPIRVPSNEFHRRIAAALSIPIIVWLIFTFLATDHHLRRQPLAGYATIALVVIFALLGSRVAMETVAHDPRNFPYIYLGAIFPIPFIIGKILIGRRT